MFRAFIRLLAVVAVAAVTACGGAARSNDGGASAAGSSHPGDNPSAGTASGGAVGSGDEQVVIVRQLAIPWQSEFGMVDVIVELRNAGTRTAQINGGEYTMYSTSGGELDKGYFLYAFPRMLGPGETGYIAERDHSESWSAADVGAVEATFDYDWLDAPAKAPVLTTAQIRHEKDPYGSGGYIAAGTVTNHSETVVPQAHIGVFYLAADGTPLGFTYTDLVENVAPGQTQEFKTYGESPPLASWVRTVVIAVAD